MNAIAGIMMALAMLGADSTAKTGAAGHIDAAAQQRIGQLIRGLGSDSYETREASQDALAALGGKAVPQIKKALDSADLEVRRRARSTLAMIQWKVSPDLRRIIGDLMAGFETRNHTGREIIVRALASAGKKRSIPTIARVIETDKHRGVWLVAVWSLFEMGQEGELALAQLGVSQNWPERLDVGIRVRLGNSLLEDGQLDKAMEQYSRALQKDPANQTALYNMACVCSRKKQIGQAVEWLRKAVDAGYDDADWMENDSDLDAIRDNPRYRQILRELRVKEQLGGGGKRPRL